MPNRLVRLSLVTVFICVSLYGSQAASACQLNIYTYDSIAGKGGLGAKIFPQFKKLTGCTVRALTSGDAVQVLGRVEIDEKRHHPEGDLILGVDTLLWDRVAKVADPGLKLTPVMTQRLEPVVQKALKRFPGMIPYDFGALTFMVDRKQLAKDKLPVPSSILDFLKPQWHRSLILEDPRTSSPGLQFVLFTKQVLGSRFTQFWKSLRSQWLAMPAGWDAAYNLFLHGNAPLVWSYVTSEAYHRSHGSTQYRALIFNEGQPLQIEGAVIVRGAPHRELAKKFMNFLVSDWVQERVGGTNWMWPVRRSMTVPPSFSKLPKVKKEFVLSGAHSAAVLKQWSEAIHE